MIFILRMTVYSLLALITIGAIIIEKQNRSSEI